MPRSNRIFKKRTNVCVRREVPKDDSDTPEPKQGCSSQTDDNFMDLDASSIKLNVQADLYDNFLKDCDDKFQYNIFEISSLNKLLSASCVCKFCRGPVELSTLTLNGLAQNVIIKCNECSSKTTEPNSKSSSYDIDDKQVDFYDINIRTIYAMRSIGKGKTDMDTFCGVMNMPPPTSKFQPIINILGLAAERVCTMSMHEAVEEAVIKNDDDRDLDAALDGTWQKKGHSSLNGVITATSVDTGKVIDLEIFTKFCRCKNKLKNEHEANCGANYTGSSGGMEVEGVINIFKRSQQQYNVRYKNYLGDGDVKAYSSVVDAMPYGKDFVIEKMECIGHIQKRMGARLRRLKEKSKSTLLSDGKSLGGRNRLTNHEIDKIQRYYGMAIRNNLHDVSEMKRAIWATYFHLASSNEKPLHGLCPNTDESWCKYKKAIRSNEEYDHDKHDHLPEAVMEAIKPVFKDLTNEELLKKCTHGKTQNANESVHNVIWKRIPKNIFVWLKTLKFGTYEAVACFNNGSITKCQILSKLNLQPGINCINAMKKIDNARIHKSNFEKLHEDARKESRQSRHGQEEKEEENAEYESGL